VKQGEDLSDYLLQGLGVAPSVQGKRMSSHRNHIDLNEEIAGFLLNRAQLTLVPAQEGNFGGRYWLKSAKAPMSRPGWVLRG